MILYTVGEKPKIQEYSGTFFLETQELSLSIGNGSVSRNPLLAEKRHALCLHFQQSCFLAVLKIHDLEDKLGTLGILNQKVLVDVTWQGGYLGGSHPIQPLGQFPCLLFGECWFRIHTLVLFTLKEGNRCECIIKFKCNYPVI